MSHVAEIKCEVRDLESLKAASERLGLTFVEGQQRYQWYGTWVGDTPMPEGMTRADLGKCDHAIKVPGSRYEVGVRAQADGSYRLVWDWWDQGIKTALGGQHGDKLTQAYGIERTKRSARAKGYTVTEQVRQDGSVKLAIRKR